VFDGGGVSSSQKMGMIVMNVFRKCLKKEFGNSDYGRYVLMCHEELQQSGVLEEEDVNDKAVYKDMYERVKKMKPDEIKQKKEMLAIALAQKLQIARQFAFVFLFYLVASIVVIALNLNPTVSHISLILMGICFLYKTYEFVCNKFCFIDAYLIMVYHSALEHASN
jgi:hypothetical protein